MKCPIRHLVDGFCADDERPVAESVFNFVPTATSLGDASAVQNLSASVQELRPPSMNDEKVGFV
jgi:hypothetical protein